MKRISVQFVRVFRFLEASEGGWRSVAEVAIGAAVSRAAAKHYLGFLLEKRLVMRAPTYGYAYRLVDNPALANPVGYAAILQAKEALGAAAQLGAVRPEGERPLRELVPANNHSQEEGGGMFSFLSLWGKEAELPRAEDSSGTGESLPKGGFNGSDPLVADTVANIDHYFQKGAIHVARSRYRYADGRRLVVLTATGHKRNGDDKRFSFELTDANVHYLHGHLKSQLVLVCGSWANSFRISYEDLHLLLVYLKSSKEEDGWLLVLYWRNRRWWLRLQNREDGQRSGDNGIGWFTRLEPREEVAAVA